MATAREESNPYDGGLGAGGKFRKRPFRRTSQTTPYDRPPTAIRNPSVGGGTNGWLSKLVDPAQRLITSSAHRLFASVFRKRLPAPPHPPQAPEPENNQEVRETPTEATSTDAPALQVAVTGNDNPNNHTSKAGVAELEELLKQKTFTRSEIDRLTTLLRSRSVDVPGGNEEKSSQLKPLVSHDGKDEFPKNPVRENGIENHLISTPIVRSTVLEEDVASPAELAKGYMDSRTSIVSISMPGSSSQVPRADSVLLSNKTFPSKSPSMSLVPRSSSHFGSLGNGFMTPRSRGRSAIYSMARTPYSRVNSAAALKGVGSGNDVFGGPSSLSSPSAWEQNRISGSRQGPLKRRSSVLDNDIGSIGPIRRIRQKCNLLSSKSLSLAASGGPLSAHEAGTSSASVDTEHHVLLPAENGDNSSSRPGFTPVPSKSSEMASKILQQLDKLVSPREKSPTKLSPSMLRGQALKSLENVDSSKFLENMHDSGNFGGTFTALPDIRDSTSHKQDKVEENSSKKRDVLFDKSGTIVNSVDTNSSMKENASSVKAADFTVIKSAVQPPQKKRQAFQISAHEDYLDVDDDDYPNGTTFATVGEGKGKLDNSFAGSKSSAAEAAIVERPSSLPSVKPISTSTFIQKPELGPADGSAFVEKDAGIAYPVSQVATSSVRATLLVSQPTSTASKDAAFKESNATPKLNFGDKFVPEKQPDVASPIFGFASKNFGEVSSVSGSSGIKLGTSSDKKPESSSSFASTFSGTTNSLSDKTDKENTPNGISFRTPETAVSSAVSTSASAGSIFKFGASATSSTLNDGSLSSSPFSFSSQMPSVVSNNGQSSSSNSTNYMSFTTNGDSSAAATTSATISDIISNTSSPSLQASVPSISGAPLFKFTSSGNPSTSASMLSASLGEATEAKTEDTCFASSIFGLKSEGPGTTSSNSGGTIAAVTSSNNSSFSGTSSTITNSASGLFGSTFSPVTSTANGIVGGTSSTICAGNISFGGLPFSIASTGSSSFPTTSTITSTGGSITGFSVPAASEATTQTQGSNPFSAVSTQASAAGTGTGIASSTQSMATQFASSASSPFGLAGNSFYSSGGLALVSTSSAAKTFGSGAAFGMSSSAETNSLSSGSGVAYDTSSPKLQAPKTSIFGSTLSSSSPSSGFPFGSSASFSALSSAPSMFGSSTGASSSSIFPFTSSAAAISSQPVFANTGSGAVFGSAPSSNNDQMEDSMAEDTVQASPPSFPPFVQQPTPTPGFVFGASNPSSVPFAASNPSAASSIFGNSNFSAASSFQFGGQPSIAASQNPSPFQASGSQEFGGAGGSFSMGHGGGDKSGRKFVKVRKTRKK